MKVLIIFFLMILLAGTTYSQLDIGYDDATFPRVELEIPPVPINYSILQTNTSNYWGDHYYTDYDLLVPYTGATGNVDLGSNDLEAENILINGYIYSDDYLFLKDDVNISGFLNVSGNLEVIGNISLEFGDLVSEQNPDGADAIRIKGIDYIDVVIGGMLGLFAVWNVADDTPVFYVNERGNTVITGDLTVDTDTLFVDAGNDRVGIGTASPSTALEVIGNITAENVFLPAYAFAHTDANISIDSAGAWYNITFNDEASDPILNISHTYNDATNDTFIIGSDGIYLINWHIAFVDFAANPTGHVVTRVIKNGVEIAGSVLEKDTTRQNDHGTIDHNIIARLSANDEIKVQITADVTTVSTEAVGTYGVHKDSGVCDIHRIA